jgi:hypothetical protein
MKTRHLLTACVLGLGLVLALLRLTGGAARAKLAATYHVSTAGTDDP